MTLSRALAGSLGRRRFRLELRLLRIALGLLCLLAAAALAAMHWDMPFAGRVFTIGDISPDPAGRWRAEIGRKASDDRNRSRAVLYEIPQDGRMATSCRGLGLWFALHFPAACHSGAVALPAGSYALADGRLTFAVSDGSDPRHNGRHYLLWLPRPETSRAAAAILALAGFVLLPWSWRGRGRRGIVALFVPALFAAIVGTANSGPVAAISLGALLILAVVLLPVRAAAAAGSLVCGLGAACGGFLLVEAGISGLAGTGALLPPVAINSMMRYLETANPAEPTVLLVGSSYAAHAIDEDLLSRLLGDSGHRLRALRLGIGGMSLIERYHYIDEYLGHARRPPRIVLFEIGWYYDTDPLRQFEQNLWTDRMVAATDPVSAWWAFKWLADPDGPSRREGLRQGAEIVGHLALHLLRAGFLSQGRWRWTVSPDPLEDRSDKAAHFDNAGLRRTLVDASETELPQPAGAALPTRWLRKLLATEIDEFRAHGATVFGFFQTPTQLAQEYDYGRRFCASMRDLPCISAADPALLEGLAHDAMWYDRTHLIGAGRELYTRWLADRIAERVRLP